MRMAAAAALTAITVLAVSSTQAAAAIDIGDTCVANDRQPGWNVIGLNNGVGAPFPPEVVPPEHGGVITRWKTSVEAGAPPLHQQLIVSQLAGERMERKIGESAVEIVNAGISEFPTRIPVPSYARIGLHGPVETIFCDKVERHLAGVVLDPYPLGEAREPEILSAAGVPVLATVEGDGDGDGYGDETQDRCTGMAAYQELCPPVGLTARSGKVGKLALPVTVGIESPAALAFAARVLVKGSVSWGKPRRTFELSSGGVQSLVPESPLTILVSLPKAVRKRLDGMRRKASLKVQITAGLDNGDAFGRPPAANLTVKLPGRRRAAPRR